VIDSQPAVPVDKEARACESMAHRPSARLALASQWFGDTSPHRAPPDALAARLARARSGYLTGAHATLRRPDKPRQA
jgi:hypothetical protein